MAIYSTTVKLCTKSCCGMTTAAIEISGSLDFFSFSCTWSSSNINQNVRGIQKPTRQPGAWQVAYPCMYTPIQIKVLWYLRGRGAKKEEGSGTVWSTLSLIHLVQGQFALMGVPNSQ